LRTLKPLQAIGLGVMAAVAVLVVSLALDPLLPRPLHSIADPGAGRSALNGLLASFYGGIAEELQLRLFLMTLLVWLFATFARRQPAPAVYWSAIVIAALLFGAGHLPAAAKLWGLSDIVVFRTIALNAIAGLVFGWLYWRRGIEMAMLGHFSADIVLHVLAPLAKEVA
jgi:membrane protease YdiL (CAAX protease family)